MAIDTRHEHEELREHAGERGDATKGEQGERHEEAQLGVGGIESIVVANLGLAAIVLLHHGDDGEHGHVGYHVDENVIDQCRCAHLPVVANSGQHDVASLRDGAESHEAFQFGLSDGKEVGDGDG